jgi:hypothetical protein
MKELFEIVTAKKCQAIMAAKKLRRPKQDWRDECPANDNGDKIKRQSDCIFHFGYCKGCRSLAVNTKQDVDFQSGIGFQPMKEIRWPFTM